MKEYEARANAGFERRSHVLGVIDDIRALLATPYAPTLSAIDNRIFILDLCQYNNVVMQLIKAFLDPCVQALIIRIGGSASVRDTRFKLFWDLAREFKMRRSIYTYNWPGWSVDLHIKNFMECIELWTPGDLGEGPIWVDIECHADKTREQVSEHSFGYITSLENETDKVVGWYSADWFVTGYMQQQYWMSEKWAWWAQWLYNQPSEHPGPVNHIPMIPDDKLIIHQTGSNCDAKLFGGTGRVDTDRWQSTEDRFYELFGGEPPAPPPGDLEEQVKRNTMDIAEMQERLNIIDDYLRSYNER